MIGRSSAAKYVLPGRLSVCVDEDAEDGDAAPARGPRRRAEAITPLPRAPNRRVRSGPPWGMTSEIFFPAPLGDLHASARTCTIRAGVSKESHHSLICRGKLKLGKFDVEIGHGQSAALPNYKA